jgi:triple functional domain protein
LNLKVCNDGKAILDSIQSSQSTQIGQMEFKQAASHILDIVYEILSNHRQLEHLWVAKKQKLQNQYRIINFQQNIKQVYNWLENHGEVFLKRNQNIPKNLMRAKMLHLSHENFVKVLKNTITNVEKLLASADDLVMNGDFDPQEIYTMTKELEQRMTIFLQRVEKRKQILDLSVLFHTHVIEIENWFNELKTQWNTFNLNDLNSSTSSNSCNSAQASNLDLIQNCIDNLDKHLDVLNEQKSVTSDAVEKTMNEGQSLVDYLKDLLSKLSVEPLNEKSFLNSLNQIESIMNQVRTHFKDVDLIMTNLKAKLEHNLQMKTFEKDATECVHNLEQWSEELKIFDHDSSSINISQDTAESWLHNQMQTSNQMQIHVFELVQRGSDIIQSLEQTEQAEQHENNQQIESAESIQLNNESNQHTLNWLKHQNMMKSESLISSKQRIQSLIDFMNDREKELQELAIRQQRKLGQTLQINQLGNYFYSFYF